MSNRKQRHLSPAGFLLALALLIVGIFAADYVYRLFFRSSTENIIGTGGFSTTSSSSGTASEDGENATDSTEETQPSGIVLQLTAADQASGPLVLADASHPYTGTSVWSDFSAVTDANVKTRSTSLQVQPEIIQPICELFDAYAAANGYANLQIYSTLDGTLDSTSIYTNILPTAVPVTDSTSDSSPVREKLSPISPSATSGWWQIPGSTALCCAIPATRQIPPELPMHRTISGMWEKSTLRSCTRTTSRWRNISIISRTIR